VELRVTGDELAALLASPSAVDDLAAEGRLVIVDGEPAESVNIVVPPLVPAVVALVDDGPPASGRGWADVVLAAADVDAVRAVAASTPQAATSLAVLLRGADDRRVVDGLLAESATYGVLQAGPEFARWRDANPARPTGDDDDERVHVERDGDLLHITLTRPARRNALDAPMRDALAEALLVAVEDPSVRVVVRGEGACFCSGGDVDEFGSFGDPASAHLIRLGRNLGRMLHRLADRTTVDVHGSCRGSGVELPAFARRVVADPDATFALPEVSMGLIPGAGGTVSLPRRIGRQRTMWLALTGTPIDATTALEWGLVDEIST
jgi:hypothetical protein